MVFGEDGLEKSGGKNNRARFQRGAVGTTREDYSR